MDISHPKTTLVIASLVLLGSSIFLWRTFRSTDNQINSPSLVGMGQVMAEESAKAIHDHGSVVAVITQEANQSDSPLHILWEAYRRELEKHTTVTLAATETIVFDPNDPTPGVGCPISAFENLLKRHGQSDVMIFFVALPSWSWFQEKTAIPASATCKIIAVDRTELNPKNHYVGYFENGILSELILNRRENGPEQVANPKTPHDYFNNEYQIFTPQNYQSLPGGSSTPPPNQP